MWVLGLLWACFILFAYGHMGDWSGWPALALLVPISLIVFSLRDRKKSN
jgi:hypothetical protein